jgi:hypothetical protein
VLDQLTNNLHGASLPSRCIAARCIRSAGAGVTAACSRRAQLHAADAPRAHRTHWLGCTYAPSGDAEESPSEVSESALLPNQRIKRQIRAHVRVRARTFAGARAHTHTRTHTPRVRMG